MSRKAEIKRGKARAGRDGGAERLPEPVWRLRLLALIHLALFFYLASWLFPVTGAWWDQLDVAVFRTFNGSLRFGEWWQVLWALANARITDLFSGALVLLLILSWLWGRPRDVQNMKLASLGALLLVLGAAIILLHPIVIKWIGFSRPSPTLVLDGVYWLDQLVPSIDAKVADRSSFPGDHAFILATFALFFVFLGPWKVALMALLLAFFFNLPRLVGGAHWLTDGAIGGVIPAVLLVSWLLATPLGYYLARMFLPLVNGIVSFLPAWLRIPEHRR